MSKRRQKVLSLAEIKHEKKSKKELSILFKKVLDNGMHGLCLSPYEEGQKPGDIISEEQIRRRMKIIQPYTRWVRSFSCTEGNELIPKIAREFDIKTMVGAWLGSDDQVNRKEIANLIELAKEGYVDLAAVGNEVMYRGDLSEDELLKFMYQVKEAIPQIQVGYVDAYYEFADRPRITEACDVIFANCYPYWEGCKLEYSLLYMKDMYRRAVIASKGKRVIVSEAGWPDRGQSFFGAEPSYENAIRYYINSQKWSEEENIEMFYFSSFDESWKIDAEGDVGAFWGLWDKTENLKY
jgi:exo-beta-1,3-glucanase (GH17 family)